MGMTIDDCINYFESTNDELAKDEEQEESEVQNEDYN